MKKSPLSDELYMKIEKMKYDETGFPTGLESTQWIHLQAGVHRGTISPMEAYDALRLGYVPAHLKLRKSGYEHLLLTL